MKSIIIGIFLRPPNQVVFMNLMVEKLCNLNPKVSDIYLLGDFTFNLFQNSNYILNGKWSTTSQGSVHTQIFFLEQLTTCLAHVTCNTSSFIHYILTNSTETTFQSEIIDSGISNHQLISVQEKWNECNKHNNILLRSLKHYTVNLFVKDLRNEFTNKIVPSKETKIKNNNRGLTEQILTWFMHEENCS